MERILPKVLWALLITFTLLSIAALFYNVLIRGDFKTFHEESEPKDTEWVEDELLEE